MEFQKMAKLHGLEMLLNAAAFIEFLEKVEEERKQKLMLFEYRAPELISIDSNNNITAIENGTGTQETFVEPITDAVDYQAPDSTGVHFYAWDQVDNGKSFGNESMEINVEMEDFPPVTSHSSDESLDADAESSSDDFLLKDSANEGTADGDMTDHGMEDEWPIRNQICKVDVAWIDNQKDTVPKACKDNEMDGAAKSCKDNEKGRIAETWWDQDDNGKPSGNESMEINMKMLSSEAVQLVASPSSDKGIGYDSESGSNDFTLTDSVNEGTVDVDMADHGMENGGPIDIELSRVVKACMNNLIVNQVDKIFVPCKDNEIDRIAEKGFKFLLNEEVERNNNEPIAACTRNRCRLKNALMNGLGSVEINVEVNAAVKLPKSAVKALKSEKTKNKSVKPPKSAKSPKDQVKAPRIRKKAGPTPKQSPKKEPKRTKYWCNLCDGFLPCLPSLKHHVRVIHKKDPSHINEFNYVCWNTQLARIPIGYPESDDDY